MHQTSARAQPHVETWRAGRIRLREADGGKNSREVRKEGNREESQEESEQGNKAAWKRAWHLSRSGSPGTGQEPRGSPGL